MHTYIHAYIHTYIHTHTYIYIYIMYTYICIHTYAYISNFQYNCGVVEGKADMGPATLQEPYGLRARALELDHVWTLTF